MKLEQPRNRVGLPISHSAQHKQPDNVLLQLLEARRLVVVHNVLAKEDSTKQAHGVWTAVVHLRRFAPRLSKEYYFKVSLSRHT